MPPTAGVRRSTPAGEGRPGVDTPERLFLEGGGGLAFISRGKLVKSASRDRPDQSNVADKTGGGVEGEVRGGCLEEGTARKGRSSAAEG